MRVIILLVVMCLAVLYLIATPVWAMEKCYPSGSALLWTPNTEADLKEYLLFVHTQPDVEGAGGQMFIIPSTPGPLPPEPGVAFRYPLSLSLANGPTYFGLKAMDNIGQASPLTPVVSCRVVGKSFQLDLGIVPKE